MPNANDICSASLKAIGVLASGETMKAGDAADAYLTLNRMIDSWRAQRLTCYQVQPYTFNLTADDPTYTLGPSGDWATPAVPIWIENASVVDNSGDVPFELPLEIFSAQRWATWVTEKTMETTFPLGLYYQRAGTNGTVNLWPVPTDATYDIRLYLPVPLAQFTDRATSVNLPAGYEEALIYQLAKRLAPLFGRVLDGVIADLAADGLALIKRSNPNMDELVVDEALQSRAAGAWNWRTGDWQL
jgi:hypothetical protein